MALAFDYHHYDDTSKEVIGLAAKMEDEERIQNGLESLVVNTTLAPRQTTIKKESDSTASSPNRSKESRSLSPDDQKARSDSASTPDGYPPKLTRKPSQKTAAQLFDDLPDVTAESCDHFQLIPDCLYGSKSLGATEHDALDCDCSEEWRKYLMLLLMGKNYGALMSMF